MTLFGGNLVSSSVAVGKLFSKLKIRSHFHARTFYTHDMMKDDNKRPDRAASPIVL